MLRAMSQGGASFRGELGEATPEERSPLNTEWVLISTHEAASAVTALFGRLEKELMIATAEKEAAFSVRLGAVARADGLLVVPAADLDAHLRQVSHAVWECAHRMTSQAEAELRALADVLQAQFKAKLEEVDAAMVERARWLTEKNEQRIQNARRSALVETQSAAVRARAECRAELDGLRAELHQLRADAAERKAKEEEAAAAAGAPNSAGFLASLVELDVASDGGGAAATRQQLESMRHTLADERRLQVSLHEKVGQLSAALTARDAAHRAAKADADAAARDLASLRERHAELEERAARYERTASELRQKSDSLLSDKIELRAKLHAACERAGMLDGAAADLNDMVTQAASRIKANAPAALAPPTGRAASSRAVGTQTVRDARAIAPSARPSTAALPRNLPMGSALAASLGKTAAAEAVAAAAAAAQDDAMPQPKLSATFGGGGGSSDQWVNATRRVVRAAQRASHVRFVDRASSPVRLPAGADADAIADIGAGPLPAGVDVSVQTMANELESLYRAQQLGQAYIAARDATLATGVAKLRPAGSSVSAASAGWDEQRAAELVERAGQAEQRGALGLAGQPMLAEQPATLDGARPATGRTQHGGSLAIGPVAARLHGGARRGSAAALPGLVSGSEGEVRANGEAELALWPARSADSEPTPARPSACADGAADAGAAAGGPDPPGCGTRGHGAAPWLGTMASTASGGGLAALKGFHARSTSAGPVRDAYIRAALPTPSGLADRAWRVGLGEVARNALSSGEEASAAAAAGGGDLALAASRRSSEAALLLRPATASQSTATRGHALGRTMSTPLALAPSVGRLPGGRPLSFSRSAHARSGSGSTGSPGFSS
ncbi:hypothetical protein KFE25_003018 [Diacronema lutheri]|uniref:Uncharacterized protein n=1 Tax=Diacronema lutheri TaxID=2081491 RepID=A0A8J6CC44_DIALT|nr:hypothetical protein KFE25_003018 [Diacronema lutheri]